MNTNQIGQRINNAMLARGMTQVDLSNASGLSQGHLSEAINGKRRLRFELMISLARALDVSLDWLAGLPAREPAQLEPAEEELVAAYRALDDAHRKVVLDMVRGLGER